MPRLRSIIAPLMTAAHISAKLCKAEFSTKSFSLSFRQQTFPSLKRSINAQFTWLDVRSNWSRFIELSISIAQRIYFYTFVCLQLRRQRKAKRKLIWSEKVRSEFPSEKRNSIKENLFFYLDESSELLSRKNGNARMGTFPKCNCGRKRELAWLNLINDEIY